VLSGKTDVLDTPENVNWVSRAMLVYRQTHSASLTAPCLSQVLSGKTDVLDTPENVNWVSRAMLVYRQAVSQGLRPSLKALDRLLACLRLPYMPPLPSDGMPTTAMSTFKVWDALG